MNKIYISFLRKLVSGLEGEEFEDNDHLTLDELLLLQTAVFGVPKTEEQETIKV